MLRPNAHVFAICLLIFCPSVASCSELNCAIYAVRSMLLADGVDVPIEAVATKFQKHHRGEGVQVPMTAVRDVLLLLGKRSSCVSLNPTKLKPAWEGAILLLQRGDEWGHYVVLKEVREDEVVLIDVSSPLGPEITLPFEAFFTVWRGRGIIQEQETYALLTVVATVILTLVTAFYVIRPSIRRGFSRNIEVTTILLLALCCGCFANSPESESGTLRRGFEMKRYQMEDIPEDASFCFVANLFSPNAKIDEVTSVTLSCSCAKLTRDLNGCKVLPSIGVPIEFEIDTRGKTVISFGALVKFKSGGTTQASFHGTVTRNARVVPPVVYINVADDAVRTGLLEITRTRSVDAPKLTPSQAVFSGKFVKISLVKAESLKKTDSRANLISDRQSWKWDLIDSPFNEAAESLNILWQSNGGDLFSEVKFKFVQVASINGIPPKIVFGRVPSGGSCKKTLNLPLDPESDRRVIEIISDPPGLLSAIITNENQGYSQTVVVSSHPVEQVGKLECRVGFRLSDSSNIVWVPAEAIIHE